MAYNLALVQVFCLSGNVRKRGKLLALKFSLILFSAEKVDQQNKNGLLGDKQKVFFYLKFLFPLKKLSNFSLPVREANRFLWNE